MENVALTNDRVGLNLCDDVSMEFDTNEINVKVSTLNNNYKKSPLFVRDSDVGCVQDTKDFESSHNFSDSNLFVEESQLVVNSMLK